MILSSSIIQTDTTADGVCTRDGSGASDPPPKMPRSPAGTYRLLTLLGALILLPPHSPVNAEAPPTTPSQPSPPTAAPAATEPTPEDEAFDALEGKTIYELIPDIT